MTVKPIETSSELIKDFILVKQETLYDAILLEVSQQKECVKKKPARTLNFQDDHAGFILNTDIL